MLDDAEPGYQEDLEFEKELTDAAEIMVTAQNQVLTKSSQAWWPLEMATGWMNELDASAWSKQVWSVSN